MDESALNIFLERIGSIMILWRTLNKSYGGNTAGSLGFPKKHCTDSAAEDPPVTRDNTSSVADVHRSEISLLVADVHLSRGINGREANVLPLTVNPPATNGVEESGKYCAYVHKLLDSLVAFLSCSSGTKQ